jgi:hypothetical protein
MPIRHRIEIEALGIKTRIRVDLHAKPPSGYFAILRTSDGERLSTIFGDFNQEKAMKVGEAVVRKLLPVYKSIRLNWRMF